MNVEITDIGSDFIPYTDKYVSKPFTSINVRPFTVNELFLIADSIKTKSIRSLIQAVDNVIDVDVNLLTVPDYYNLYYWLRFMSYPKTPPYVEWTCNNLQVVDDELVKCGHLNVSRLKKTDVKVHHLSACGPIELNPMLDFPRVSLLLSVEDLEDDNGPVRDLFNVAMWVKEGVTINEKVAVLRSAPDLSLYEDALHASRTYVYGADEFVSIKCEVCGVKGYVKVPFNATTFLP